MLFYLFNIALYLVIPCGYAAIRALRRRLLPRMRKIIVCVISAVVTFGVSIPIALWQIRIPSVLSLVIGAPLAYFACGWVHQQVRNR